MNNKKQNIFSISKALLCVVLFLSLLYCKKSHLSGDYSKFVGSWAWIDGYEDNGKTSWNLEILEKGKYKLRDGKKVLEAGRIQILKGRIEFKANDIKSKGFLDEKNCKINTDNNLEVTKFDWTDQPVSLYKKQ